MNTHPKTYVDNVTGVACCLTQENTIAVYFCWKSKKNFVSSLASLDTKCTNRQLTL